MNTSKPPDVRRHLSCSLDVLAVSLEMRDLYTRQHCDRVGDLCDALARHCTLDHDDRRALGIAARFHDIGKIGIPDHVLHHAGPLNEADRALMQTHSERGERLFLATAMPDAARVSKMIRHHHEAIDGKGYPDGLRGEQIPLAIRILTLVDAYDAMITDRPYRDAMSHGRVMQQLEEECGKRIDPELFRVFVPLVDAETRDGNLPSK